MAKVKNLIFAQPKTLPTLGLLKNVFGINFNAISQEFDSRHFEVQLNGFAQILAGGTYSLQEFITDYYEMELSPFCHMFSQKLKRGITERGFIKPINGATQQMAVRDLAFFASQQRKYGRKLQLGRLQRSDYNIAHWHHYSIHQYCHSESKAEKKRYHYAQIPQADWTASICNTQNIQKH